MAPHPRHRGPRPPSGTSERARPARARPVRAGPASPVPGALTSRYLVPSSTAPATDGLVEHGEHVGQGALHDRHVLDGLIFSIGHGPYLRPLEGTIQAAYGGQGEVIRPHSHKEGERLEPGPWLDRAPTPERGHSRVLARVLAGQ